MEPKDRNQGTDEPQKQNPGHLVTPTSPERSARDNPDAAHDRAPRKSTRVNDDDAASGTSQRRRYEESAHGSRPMMDPHDGGQEPDNVGTANAGDEQAADIVSRVGEESPDVEHDEPDHPKGESEPA